MSIVAANPIQEKINEMLLSRIVKGAETFRQEAKIALMEIEIPNPKMEDWKYTRVGKILNQNFKNEDSNLPDLSKYTDYNEVLVFVNGRFNFELSKINNVKFQFTNAVEWNALPFYNHAKNYFTALNGSYFTTGIYSEEVNNKTAIVHFATGNTFSNVHHFLKAKKNQSVDYDFYFISDEENNFSNIVIQAEIEENAQLRINQFQNEGEKSSQVNLVHAYQHANSKFGINTISTGGNLTRNDLNIIVDGENCETFLNGIYLTNNSQHIDNHTLVDHRKPHCMSDEKYRGIMNDQSTGVFNGKVFVRQDAQKINAFQSNANILLSDDATINSKPELEIYADDVKCSHGSTTGQLDEEALFYLQSRGIGLESARKLLVRAFVGDVVDEMEDGIFKTKIEEVIEEKLK